MDTTTAPTFTATHYALVYANGTTLRPCVVVRRTRATADSGPRVVVQFADGTEHTTIPSYVTKLTAPITRKV